MSSTEFETTSRRLGAYLYLKLENCFEYNIVLNDISDNVEKYLMLGSKFNVALNDLDNQLTNLQLGGEPDEITIQTVFYDVGKKYYGIDKEQLREWFRHLYLLLFEKEDGARWGQFVKLLGIPHFLEMVRNKAADPFKFNI